VALRSPRLCGERGLERIAIAFIGRLTESVPRAVASGLHPKTRSLPLAVLIRTVISVWVH
jgi:ribosomal protein S4E